METSLFRYIQNGYHYWSHSSIEKTNFCHSHILANIWQCHPESLVKDTTSCLWKCLFSTMRLLCLTSTYLGSIDFWLLVKMVSDNLVFLSLCSVNIQLALIVITELLRLPPALEISVILSALGIPTSIIGILASIIGIPTSIIGTPVYLVQL